MADEGGWEPVIGLEIHAQLCTRTKLFCACATSFGDPPNTHTCPVCLGLPGALPVMNAEALRLAVRAALALGCTVRARSIFARKNYFYPDLPKGYQISQYEEPLAVSGGITVGEGDAERRIGIRRLHLEEDAGKNLHGVAGTSKVDLNRAGTPLVEIVSEPELHSPAEARDYMKRLRDILMFAGVNDGNLEEGSFRCDANVSVRPRGERTLGTRVEMKNINSFRFVEDALAGEIQRQIGLLEEGRRLSPETRGYNAEKRESYSLRSKEGEEEYRYFPDPDLPPLCADEALVAETLARLPEMPDEKRARWTRELGLSEYAAGVLSAHPRIAAFFEETVMLGADATRVANFIQSEVLRDVKLSGLQAEFAVSPRQIAELSKLVDEGTISGKQAKEIHAAMRGTGRSATELVEALGMKVIRDQSTLQDIARRLVASHPQQAQTYRSGKTGVLGFFVGQLMKETRGAADPRLASELLERELARSGEDEG